MEYFTTVQKHLIGRRRRLSFILYALIVVVAYALAYTLRFEFDVPEPYVELFGWTLVPLVLVRLFSYRVFRLMRERWRYVSTRDVVRLFGATALGSALFFIFQLVAPLPLRVPLAVIGLEGVLVCWLTGAAWLSYRVGFEELRQRAQLDRRRTRALLIGCGEAGTMLARAMLRSPTGYLPVGFVDDDETTLGSIVCGVEVFGGVRDVASIARRVAAEELIIAVPSAEPATLRRIVAECEATGLPLKVLPGIREVLEGDVSVSYVREIRIEDLLGREPVRLELPTLEADLAGRVVLITGAAGSIGSELARQVAFYGPRRLLLLDNAESALFYVDMDLRAQHPELDIIPIIADAADGYALDAVFSEHGPQRVFHAAAYKHVPLMEHNAVAAIRNNVIGTWRVANAAGRFGAEKFVLISTDKAVQPANVMGATKRLAELIVIELQASYPETLFGAVRFGNVLGSTGSVLPIFRRQLDAGLPLTITHPQVSRYFMTIPEAVQLVLQASLVEGLGGHIAMLEMGEPVRIVDLAANLLRLSGVPDWESRVVFTGLRDGEKMHEELVAPDEHALPTMIPKVHILQTQNTRLGHVLNAVSGWDRALQQGDAAEVLAAFHEIFPEVKMDRLQPRTVRRAGLPSFG